MGNIFCPVAKGDIGRAARDGKTERVRALLAREDVDANENALTAQSPLMQAACYGHPEIVKLLLDDPRVDPALLCNWKFSAFHFAVDWCVWPVVCVFVDDPRTDVNLEINYYGTALAHASLCGSTDVVRCLLSCDRTNVNIQGKGGFAALHRACQKGHMDVAKLLLADSRTDLFAENEQGQSPFDIAVVNNDLPIVKLFLQREEARVRSDCMRLRLAAQCSTAEIPNELVLVEMWPKVSQTIVSFKNVAHMTHADQAPFYSDMIDLVRQFIRDFGVVDDFDFGDR